MIQDFLENLLKVIMMELLKHLDINGKVEKSHAQDAIYRIGGFLTLELVGVKFL